MLGADILLDGLLNAYQATIIFASLAYTYPLLWSSTFGVDATQSVYHLPNYTMLMFMYRHKNPYSYAR